MAGRPSGVAYDGIATATVGLLVYGLTRLAGLARELEGLRGELTLMAAAQERLRVARDVHDLLGLGLSAIALKAGLAAALIGRDDIKAAAEVEEMSRICAAARADIRLVATGDARLSLASEVAAAKQILTSTGIKVTADSPDEPLPAAADEVLAPVLREAVTNVLRHAAATARMSSASRTRITNPPAQTATTWAPTLPSTHRSFTRRAMRVS